MLASGARAVKVSLFGETIRELGTAPKLHCILAPIQPCIGIIRFSETFSFYPDSGASWMARPPIQDGDAGLQRERVERVRISHFSARATKETGRGGGRWLGRRFRSASPVVGPARALGAAWRGGLAGCGRRLCRHALPGGGVALGTYSIEWED